MELNAIQMLGNYTPTKKPSAGPQASDAELRKTCKEFEAILLEQMLKSMRKTINKTGLMEGGMGEDVFEDMLYQKYAEKMSKTANLGLSDMLYQQLSQNYTQSG